MIKIIIISFLYIMNLHACEDLTNSISCKGSSYPIHLTFDDGPTDYNTTKVLDVLKSEGVKATFFVLLNRLINKKGNKVNISQRRKELNQKGISNYYYHLLDRMKKDGHNVGSHTSQHIHHYSQLTKNRKYLKQRHEELTDWSRNIFQSENENLREYFFQKKNAYLRLPYGEGWYEQKSKNNKKKEAGHDIMNTIEKAGFTHVGWNIDSNDWRYDNSQVNKFIQDNLEQICNNKGGVMLMHDTKNIVAKNLKCLIKNMKRMNFKFVSMEHFENKKTLSGLNVIGKNRSIDKISYCKITTKPNIPDFIGNFINTLSTE